MCIVWQYLIFDNTWHFTESNGNANGKCKHECRRARVQVCVTVDASTTNITALQEAIDELVAPEDASSRDGDHESNKSPSSKENSDSSSVTPDIESDSSPEETAKVPSNSPANNDPGRRKWAIKKCFKILEFWTKRLDHVKFFLWDTFHCFRKNIPYKTANQLSKKYLLEKCKLII